MIGYEKAKSVFLPYLFVLFLSFVFLLMKSVGSGNNALHTHVLSKFMVSNHKCVGNAHTIGGIESFYKDFTVHAVLL